MGKTLFVTFIALLLLVSSCQDFGGFGFGKDKSPQQSTFVGGTKGISIAFSEDQPPTAILDDNQEELFIALLLKNGGEYTIPVGGLIGSLSGIKQKDFSINSFNKKNDFEIYGTVKEGDIVIPGAEELLEFGNAAYKVDLPGDIDFQLRADVCYDYQTQAVTKICLKENVLKKGFADVCEINNPSLQFENSGGPVQITDVRESTVGSSKVKVTFKVVNKDVGAVFLPHTFSDACSGHESDKDKVKVSVFNPAKNFDIACNQLGGSASGSVKLINKEKDISCTIETGSFQEASFQDVLIVQLDYQYRQAVTTPLRVINSL